MTRLSDGWVVWTWTWTLPLDPHCTYRYLIGNIGGLRCIKFLCARETEDVVWMDTGYAFTSHVRTHVETW